MGRFRLVAGAVLLLSAPLSVPAGGEAVVSLVFVGDVMPARNLPPHSPYNPEPLDFAHIFELTAPILQAADLAFCNLESPISGRGTPLNKRYAFNAPVEAADGLKAAGFDVVSLANNHCLDYGPEALSDTLAHLDARGIHAVGIAPKGAPQKPVIVEVGGVRVGYLAYMSPDLYWGEIRQFCPGPAIASEEAVVADITRLREDADIVVVSFHWGMEHTTALTGEQKRLGPAAIDAGAHLVVGHHPHVQQSIVTHGRGIILHSLGNFAFARWSPPGAQDTRIFRCLVDRNGIRGAEYLPVRIVSGRWRPEPQSEEWVAVVPAE